MPIYEFRCRACENIFEKLCRLSDAAPPRCPKCGSEDTARQLSLVVAPTGGAEAAGAGGASGCSPRKGFT